MNCKKTSCDKTNSSDTIVSESTSAPFQTAFTSSSNFAGSFRNLSLLIGVILLLLVGVVYAWSILSVPLASEFGWNSQELSVNYSVMMSFFCLSGIAGGILCNKTNSSRVALMISAVLTLVGFAGTAYFTFGHIFLLYLFYGVCVGSGVGFAYNSIVGAVSSWFPDKRGFASGVLLMGFGASTLVLGSLASTLIDGGILSWQHTFLMFGGASFAGLLLGSFVLRFPQKEELLQYSGVSNSAKATNQKNYTPREMLRTKAFWLMGIFSVCGAAIGGGVISHAKQIAISCGAAASTATLCVGLLSVSNGLGRVFFGMIYDKKGRKVSMRGSVAVYLVAVLLILASLFTATPVFVIPGMLLFGIAYGSMPTTSAAFVASEYGPKYYSTNFSLMNLNLMISSFTSIISGTLVVQSGSYISSFIFYLLLCCGMFVLNLLLNTKHFH